MALTKAGFASKGEDERAIGDTQLEEVLRGLLKAGN
jgi:hypothetical protein